VAQPGQTIDVEQKFQLDSWFAHDHGDDMKIKRRGASSPPNVRKKAAIPDLVRSSKRRRFSPPAGNLATAQRCLVMTSKSDPALDKNVTLIDSTTKPNMSMADLTLLHARGGVLNNHSFCAIMGP
jgi:hypothetical protein